MQKKPIYGGVFILKMYDSDSTCDVFLKKASEYHRGFSGAAQDMDLFLHTSPLSAGFMRPEGEQEKKQEKYLDRRKMRRNPG